MLKILKKYKKWIFIFSFVYIYLIMVLIAPSALVATAPGQIDNTSNIYSITDSNTNKDIKFTNDINTISVFSYQRLTIFQKWLTQNNPKYDVYIPSLQQSELTNKEMNLQGSLSNNSSHNNAVITAYSNASKVNNDISINYDLLGLTIYDSNIRDLVEIGDLIIAVNNIPLLPNINYETYIKDNGLVHSSSRELITSNNPFSLKVVKNYNSSNSDFSKYEIKDINVKANSIIRFLPSYKIKETNPTYNGHVNQLFVGGPSGGAIQAMAIYTAIMGIDLDNIKIAGTGTIETNELNNVGNIGGLVQKFYTVKYAKVDYFLVPKNQYDEIKHLDKNIKFEIVPIDSFSDIVNFVSNVGDK